MRKAKSTRGSGKQTDFRAYLIRRRLHETLAAGDTGIVEQEVDVCRIMVLCNGLREGDQFVFAGHITMVPR